MPVRHIGDAAEGPEGPGELDDMDAYLLDDKDEEAPPGFEISKESKKFIGDMVKKMGQIRK